MRKKRFSALALAATALGTAVLTLAVSTLGLLLFMGRPGLGVAEAMGLIHTQFVGEGDVQAAADKGMSALVTGLEDRWSYYVDEAGLGRLRESQNNAYVGIGVTVEYRGEEGATIIKVTAGGPADTAGLRVGDVILTVNTADEEGQPLSVRLTGEDRSRAPELIRGPAGSEIELQVRAADGAERWMNITRGRVEEDPVTYALLEDGTGLVTIKNFNRRCADGAIAAVDDLIDQGATQLVFDVRNNGGGYLDELTRLLDHLLPEGVIFRTSDKAGRTSSVRSDAGCVDLPMAVLVNGETYSASEFFAAELREQGWAVVVGSKTFGKGYSQQTFPLLSGGALNISTAKYFTGEGVSLIGTGVALDRELDLDEEQAAALAAGTLPPAEDPQLQAALSLLARAADS